MKLSKKSQSVLFVEDEKRYNWTNSRKSLNRRLIYLSVLFISAAILLSALN